MSRAEKRRQRKASEKADKKTKSAQLESRFSEPQALHIRQALDLAMQHLHAGRLREAESNFQQILQADPNQHVALHLLGVIAYQRGNNGIAVDLITKALATKPDYIEAHNNLGNALRNLGRMDDALASFHKALSIDPNYSNAHYNLGNTLNELGKPDEALASYHKALAIEPNYVEAHTNLGNTLQELGKLDEAKDSFRKALAIKPNFAEAHINLGITLYKLGKLDEAIASFHKAIAIKLDHGNAWNALKFATKARRFSEIQKKQKAFSYKDGLSDFACTSADFTMLEYYLDSFRPHESDDSFRKAMAALPPKADEEVSVNGHGRKPVNPPQLPTKMVALLQFGRSGTGLLHSLVDSHPEVSTLPSIYLRGFFDAGVWNRISADGWRGLPNRFADEFAVLFDANSPKYTPGGPKKYSFKLGIKEGMAIVGENRDEALSLDRNKFCSEVLRMMKRLDKVDPGTFLQIVHAAYEKVIKTKTIKQTAFYHIHNPDDFTKLNFLRYAPNARLIMMIREPMQSCESWLRTNIEKNDYEGTVQRIITMLFAIDQVAFRTQEAVGIRLEDLKNKPKETMRSLCAWLGIQETPSLYQMTAQGKKWWGDPSSPDYLKDKAMSPFDDTTTKRPVGTILGEEDQFILRTLFYPISVRFGYQQADPHQFQKDLQAIRPLLDDMLNFEKTIAERSNIDHRQFKRNGSYQLLRAGMVDRWNVLNELGTYPYMLEPLPIA